jgi:hypothetical protein
MSIERVEIAIPTIGKTNGIIYPLAFWFLQIEKWWPTERLLLYRHRDSRLITDIYIAAFWVIEALGLYLLFNFSSILPLVRIAVIVLLVYRLVEIVLKLIATLVLGRYRLPTEHHFQNRTVLLTLANLLEIIFIYAAFYFLLDTKIAHRDPIGVKGFLDTLYFSIATGITISFGQQFPKEIAAKLITISEPLVIFVIVIGMLSFARSSSGNIKTENTKRKYYKVTQKSKSK